MRSLELLIQLFPDKTGSELLEIQKQDKLDDENNFKVRHQAKLDIIERINTKGGYFKGKFGENQYFYYSLSNLRLDPNNGEIYCSVKKIVCFFEPNGLMNMEFSVDTHENFEDYGTEFCEPTTKGSFDHALNSFKELKKLWS